MNAKALLNYAGSLLGALLFVIAMNLIIVPHALYSGTLTGVAQIIEDIILSHTHVQVPENYNITGIALLLLNIPLMIMVLKVHNTGFPFKTILTIVFLTATMALIPIPSEPIIYDALTACIVGGAIAGFGAGFTLRCGGSGGGTDLIGVFCSVKYPNFTVGKVSLIIGFFVYSYALFAYDLNTVIYSAIFTMIYSFVLDHVHYQNIKTSAFIFTTKPEAVQALIIDQLSRGATVWEGKGAYSGKHTHIFVTVVSKYEMPQLKRNVSKADSGAFIIFNNKVGVEGNFQRRL